MRKRKKTILCLFTTLLMLGSTTSVFATGFAGDSIVDCNVTLTMMDETGTYNGKKITADFKDVTGTVEEKEELTPDNSWGSGDVFEFTLQAPTTYNVTFSGVKDGYKIVDATTNKEVSGFAATANGADLYWSIVSADTETENAAKTENGTTTTDESKLEVSDQDAESVYQEFLQAVSFIETDPTWSDGFAGFLNQYGEDSVNRNTYSQWYADFVRGGTVEGYFAMSSYEQFLWTETYTRLAEAAGGYGDFDMFYKDEGAFETHVTKLVTNLMNGNNSEVVKEAYLKLMAWQYNYVKTNGVPFNFINNRSYIEEVGEAPVQDDTAVKEEEAEEIDQAIAEAKGEDEKAEKQSTWSATMDILADNAVTIIVLAVLAIAVAVVMYIRKNKNIGEK